MLNNITIAGRLTKAPELRYTSTNTPVASFTLAVDRDGKDKGTDFIDCVAWKSTAEFIKKHLDKGSMAIIHGRLQIRDWTDKDGKKRYSPEVIADRVYFGETKRKEEKGGAFTDLDDEDDCPF